MYVLLVYLFPVLVYVLETCFFRVTFFGPTLCQSFFLLWVLGWTEHVLWYFVLQRGTEFQDILGLLRSLWWVGGLASSSFPGGSRRPNQTCWYYTRFLFSGLMSDFCINAYHSVTSYCLSHANRESDIRESWIRSSSGSSSIVTFMFCRGGRGTPRCSLGCRRMRAGQNMGTSMRGWRKGSRVFTSM